MAVSKVTHETIEKEMAITDTPSELVSGSLFKTYLCLGITSKDIRKHNMVFLS